MRRCVSCRDFVLRGRDALCEVGDGPVMANGMAVRHRTAALKDVINPPRERPGSSRRAADLAWRTAVLGLVAVAIFGAAEAGPVALSVQKNSSAVLHVLLPLGLRCVLLAVGFPGCATC